MDSFSWLRPVALALHTANRLQAIARKENGADAKREGSTTISINA
jgi:hypothetical protein